MDEQELAHKMNIYYKLSKKQSILISKTYNWQKGKVKKHNKFQLLSY